MTEFKSLLENYRIIFFDAYGVIKNYEGLIPGIEKTFDWLTEQVILCNYQRCQSQPGVACCIVS